MSASVNPDVVNYLEGKRLNCQDLKVGEIWQKLQDFYNKRLWHQLTLVLQEFMNSGHFSSENELAEIYEEFISDIELRINPLALVEIALCVVQRIADTEKALRILRNTLTTVKNDVEPAVLCKTAMGHIYLMTNDLQAIKRIIDETEFQLKEIEGITSVHARFYDLCSKYHKMQGAFVEYYADSLRFLGCIDISNMIVSEQRERARDLSIAALLAKNLFNLGELLAHPILNSLRNTDEEWIINLLLAFNKGDQAAFENLRPYWEERPELSQNENKLRQKLALFGLVELTFHRPSNNRILSFDDISRFTRTSIDSVEILVMKAFCHGLIEGKINQVLERAEMTWVQPRVLDVSQLSQLKAQTSAWSNRIKTVAYKIQDRAPEAVA